MIDWHSHILPQMDDGSKSIDESLKMIEMLSGQYIDIVIATPHFYANDEGVTAFLKRREASYKRLLEAKEKLPVKIILGAEVKYYPGISKMEDLEALRIEGTNLILLEMPMAKWPESTIRELWEIQGKWNFQIILAHIERSYEFQSKDVWEKLSENGILMQSNASFFKGLFTKMKALDLMKKGIVNLVGSDCHNTTSRPPKIGEAYEIIQKKFGEDYLAQMDEYGKSILE